MAQSKSFNLLHLWLWPTVVCFALIPFLTTLDLTISTFFYKLYPGFAVPKPVKLIYHWGTLPSIFIGLTAFFVLITNIRPVWQKYRTSALMAFLALIIGPGLIINIGLKGSFHRPRPVQIENFGGKYKYVPITKMKFETGNKHQRSFPSGHTSMGFFFLCLWRIAFREGKKNLSYLSLALAFLVTLFLSWTRLAQGGHFFSDILFSGLITWLTIIVLEAYCYGKHVPAEAQKTTV